MVKNTFDISIKQCKRLCAGRFTPHSQIDAPKDLPNATGLLTLKTVVGTDWGASRVGTPWPGCLMHAWP